MISKTMLKTNANERTAPDDGQSPKSKGSILRDVSSSVKGKTHECLNSVGPDILQKLGVPWLIPAKVMHLNCRAPICYMI